MSIGIGIPYVDGIVLAADQQLTASGSHKRYESKLRQMGGGSDWSAVFAYAGNPDFMAGFYEALTDHLNLLNVPINCEAIRSGIEIGLAARYSPEDIQHLQLLCGASVRGKVTRLFKNSGHRVRDTTGINHIGCGDSSLLGYLTAQVANRPLKTLDQAIWIAVRLVYGAKKWIDGSGGQTDVWSLRGGTVITETPRVANIERVMDSLEFLMGNVISDLFAITDRKQFQADLDLFIQNLLEEYSKRNP